jgi:Undecaprenyl-phosphate glucose phosphotransferase
MSSPASNKKKSQYVAGHLIVDLLLVNVMFHLAYLIRFGTLMFISAESTADIPSWIYPVFEGVLTVGWIIIAYAFDLYGAHRRRSQVARALIALFGIAALFIIVQGGMIYLSRIFLLYFYGLSAVALIINHSRLVHKQRHSKRSVIIVGAGKAGSRFYHNIIADPYSGYQIVGFLDDNGADSELQHLILGTLKDFENVSARHTIDEVIIALPKTSEQSLAEFISTCENKLIRVNVIPNDYAALDGRRIIEHVGGFSLVRLREAPLDRTFNKIVKRTFDVIFSCVVLVCIFPIAVIVFGVLIKLGSRGPIFFRQVRTGEDGKDFTCYKFRTMRQQPRELSDSLQATSDDARLTAIGRFMRRTNLDELPQFINVLRGEMSVVGPRPHMIKHTEDYKRIINNYMLRHFVKPGITGWAQINGLRGETETPDKMDQRVRYDIYYIDNWTFTFDLYIIWRTIISMLRGDKNAY